MGPDPIQELQNEDQKLRVGDTVKAFWHRDGFYFHAKGVVAFLNRKRVRVKLCERDSASNRYSIGDEIEIPRIADCTNWSSDSCVRRIKLTC